MCEVAASTVVKGYEKVKASEASWAEIARGGVPVPQRISAGSRSKNSSTGNTSTGPSFCANSPS